MARNADPGDEMDSDLIVLKPSWMKPLELAEHRKTAKVWDKTRALTWLVGVGVPRGRFEGSCMRTAVSPPRRLFLERAVS
jgi:hypothetical protein